MTAEPLEEQLTFGESWHNNYHAFPHSARQDFSRQIELTWLQIRLMRSLTTA